MSRREYLLREGVDRGDAAAAAALNRVAVASELRRDALPSSRRRGRAQTKMMPPRAVLREERTSRTKIMLLARIDWAGGLFSILRGVARPYDLGDVSRTKMQNPSHSDGSEKIAHNCIIVDKNRRIDLISLDLFSTSYPVCG